MAFYTSGIIHYDHTERTDNKRMLATETSIAI